MARNGKSPADKRLEFLERVFLEDRERWRTNDERWRTNDERWRRNDERLSEMLAEFREDFEDVMKVLVEHSRKIEKLQQSNDAILRILRRRMEQ